MKTEFSYWKHPWQKWAVLAGALLQIPALLLNVHDFQTVRASGIYSAEKLIRYQSMQHLKIFSNVLMFGLFAGAFLIGIFSRSRKQAKLGECILFLLTAAGTAAELLLSGAEGIAAVLAGIIVLIALMGALASFRQYRKES